MYGLLWLDWDTTFDNLESGVQKKSKYLENRL